MSDKKSAAEQLQYLDAMGIQVWQRRDMPQVQEEVDEPAVASDVEQPVISNVTEEAVAETTVVGNNMGWDELASCVAGCSKCELHQQRTQAVLGVGNHNADWMIIGEAPGADEDAQGEPFVGRAGQLLNLMLKAIGLERQEVYIANIVKCRPPGNRDPKPEEAEACETYLKNQIALVQPKIILSVGRVSAHNLLKTDQKVGAMRGKRFEYADTGIPVVVTYHPAYLLRSPAEKRKAWQDLLFARQIAVSD